MSLDEAIRYYSHLADECRRKANIERYDYMDLKDLAAEHGQLADWLNELKVLREKIRVLLEKQEKDRWIPVTERMPEENIPILLGVRFKDDFKYFVTTRVDYNYWTGLGRDIRGKLAWMPLPEPWRGEKDD